MAKCIHDILGTTVSTPQPVNSDGNPISKSALPSNASYGLLDKGGDITLGKGLIDDINSLSRKLNSTDCGQVVQDYISNSIIFKKISAFERSLIDMVNEASSSSFATKTIDITKKICSALVVFFKTLSFYIDVGTKMLPALIKKIERLKRKLEDALNEFTKAIANCLLGILTDVKSALSGIGDFIVDMLSWDSLLQFMKACPCVTEIVAKMFGCQEDDDGNKLTTANEVYNCVLDKFSFLDPSAIIEAINNSLDKYIGDNIQKGAALIMNIIKATLHALMTPLRVLMRMYAKILNYKIDVTGILEGSPFQCLFVFTTEYDVSGESYLGMSILDMINTFKLWGSCVEFACSSLGDDITNKIKELNEKLRLDDKYWLDISSIDLYQAAVGSKVQVKKSNRETLRQVYTKKSGGNIDIIGSVTDAFKQMGLNAYEDAFKSPSYSSNYGSNAMNAKYADGPEKDNPTGNGSEKINKQIENVLMEIESNLASGDDSYYFEKYLQLTRYLSKYVKSKKHIDKLNKFYNQQNEIKVDFTRRYSNKMDIRMPRIVFDETEPTPSYKIKNDYNSSTVNTILNTKVTRNVDEPLSVYYKRMYNAMVV